MPFVPILLAFVVANAAWISLAITVASALYQRERAARAQAASAAAADAQKGLQVISESTASQLPVFYGRNKVGGTRVYHKVSGNYTYTAPGSGGVAFLSSGDTKTSAGLVNNVVITDLSMVLPGAYDFNTDVVGSDNVITKSLQSITASIDSTLQRMTLTLPFTDFDASILPNSALAAGYIALTHIPIFKDSSGNQSTIPVSVNYKIYSYNSVTKVLTVNLTGTTTKINSPALNASVFNTKNEFMFVEQILGYTGVTKCYAVDIDDQDWRNDTFGNSARIHVYGSGGVADPMISANDSNRSTALFTNASYAAMVFRLNRDDPQYRGVPNVQFYVEGMALQRVNFDGTNYTLSGTKTYSNAASLCLLDYLLDPVYGKGLSASQVDLKSFYHATEICERIVLVNGTTAPLAGKLWIEKGKTQSRFVRLYECNLGIDTSKSIRDNIDILLETMGRSELVWSGGKYKLQLEYPLEFGVSGTTISGNGTTVAAGSTYNLNDVVQAPAGYTSSVDLYRSLKNANTDAVNVTTSWAQDVVSAYITDNDIIDDESVTQSWPSTQNKLNYFTVRFLNEAKDFAEDSVSWPPKYGSNAVYNSYLAADNGVKLEGETFQSGDTDAYHALATAEERVRSSRVQNVYSFAVAIQYAGLEPGDFIKVTSSVLNIPGELMQIESVKVNDKNVAVIQCVKYDARNLAWNAKDNEIVTQRNIFNNQLGQASNLVFNITPLVNGLSSGVISWNLAQDTRVRNYVVKITEDSITQVNESTVWKDLGTTSGPYLDIALIKPGSWTITVVAIDGNGIAAPFNDPKTGSKWPLLSKSVDSSAFGLNVAVLSIYQRSSTPLTVAPINGATPYGGTYNFKTSAQTGVPTGWSTIIPSGDTALYISQTRAKVRVPDYIDSALVWGTPSLFTQGGVSSRTLTVYTRAVNPSVIPTGGSFTFPNGITIPPTSADATWTLAPPTGTTALWQSQTVATLPGTTGINTNVLSWSAPATIVTPADMVAEVYIYKFSTVNETGPTAGVVSYTWFDGSQVITTALNNGWTIDIPTNPGTANAYLFRAKRRLVAPGGSSTTAIDWSTTTGRTIEQVTINGSAGSNGTNGSNGINGLQAIAYVLYQWSNSGAPTITGSGYYKWADGTFNTTSGGTISAIPTGWTTTVPNNITPGFTLYRASNNLLDSSANANTFLNLTGSVIAGVSYNGFNGTNGTNGINGTIGSNGTSGASARLSYSKTNLSTLSTTPAIITTSGSISFQPNDSWGIGTIWSGQPPTVALVAGETVYQSNGLYDPVTGNTTWSVPYLSTFKVGSLSAISGSMGTLAIDGTLSSANGNFSVDATGAVVAKAITIKDAFGNIVLASGATGLDYAKVIGSTRPADNATVGADWATNVTGAAGVNSNISSAATTANWSGVTNNNGARPADYATVGANGSNLTVGVSGNILSNCTIADPAPFIRDGSGGAETGPTLNNDWSPYGSPSIYILRSGITNSASGVSVMYNNTLFPVKGSQRYELSAYISSHRCNSFFRIYWYDGASPPAYLGVSDGVTITVANSKANSMASWDSTGRSTAFAISPPGAIVARFAAVQVYIGNGTSNINTDNAYTFMSMAFLAEANTGQTVFSRWSGGSLGATQGVFALAPKLDSVSISTYMAAAAINLAQINTASIGSLSALSATIGTFQSATSGQRTLIQTDKIIVYDTNGIQRVTIGNLA